MAQDEGCTGCLLVRENVLVSDDERGDGYSFWIFCRGTRTSISESEFARHALERIRVRVRGRRQRRERERLSESEFASPGCSGTGKLPRLHFVLLR